MKTCQLYRKMITLCVIGSFLFLTQISVMPLTAETSTPQQTGISAQPEQPGTIEQVATSGRHAAKKSPILPIIIGVVVVGAVAAVLILVVFKTKYDIMGDWQLHYDLVGYDEATITITFTGTRESGTFTETYGNNGTYTVDGKKVHFKHNTYDLTWDGEFTGKDSMTGTVVYVEGPTYYGTWEATRLTSAAAVQPTQPGADHTAQWGK